MSIAPSPFSHVEAETPQMPAAPAPEVPQQPGREPRGGLHVIETELELTTSKALRGRASLELVSIDEIHPDPDQPRKIFDEEKLRELADSIREEGVLQPITLRIDLAGRKILWFGERRFRAAQLAGLTHIPAIIRHGVKDSSILAQQIIENEQRESLDPIDVARGVRRYMHDNNLWTYDRVAKALGKSTSWAANHVRLLDLSEEDQARVSARTLGVTQAAALARQQTGNTRAPRKTTSSKSSSTRSSTGETWRGGREQWASPTSIRSGTVVTGKAVPAAPTEYFNSRNPLADWARHRCETDHGRQNLMPGGVACAECWDRAIRRDERLYPTPEA